MSKRWHYSVAMTLLLLPILFPNGFRLICGASYRLIFRMTNLIEHFVNSFPGGKLIIALEYLNKKTGRSYQHSAMSRWRRGVDNLPDREAYMVMVDKVLPGILAEQGLPPDVIEDIMQSLSLPEMVKNER